MRCELASFVKSIEFSCLNVCCSTAASSEKKMRGSIKSWSSALVYCIDIPYDTLYHSDRLR